MLTDLNPWVVSFHLFCSLAIIGVAVRLLRRSTPRCRPRTAARRRSRGPPSPPPGPCSTSARWSPAPARTPATSTRPQRPRPAPDEPAPRRPGLPVRGAHPRPVVHAAGGRRRPGGPPRVSVLLAVEVAQGSIGFVQYFTGLPVVLVGFHMLGAAVISACVTWVLLRVRHPLASRPLACGHGFPRPHDPRRRSTRARVRRFGTHQCPRRQAGSAARCPGWQASSPGWSWCRCPPSGSTRSSRSRRAREPGAAGDRRTDRRAVPHLFERITLDLLGANRPGIVSEISAALADAHDQHRGAQHRRARRPDGGRDVVRGAGPAERPRWAATQMVCGRCSRPWPTSRGGPPALRLSGVGVRARWPAPCRCGAGCRGPVGQGRQPVPDPGTV